ncbi:hypothetical protein SO802_011372 [Lithocarpus litseifolius]|uniref:Reverse transcriptase zinc-binding domain-containing protein n=1 Tax=Lithocarpus litseifolius TaxID=425828 RepID=A0AAW2D3L4_9ROSI
MVSALIDHDTKHWKADLVKRIFLPFEADTILSIPLSYTLPDDKLIWMGNRRGEFTVRSAYYVALPIVESIQEGESSCGDPRTQLWKKVWHFNLPSKIRIFAWRACMNALPTMLNLKIRGVCTEAICPTCDQCIENTSHAFLECDTPRSIWSLWSGRPAFLENRQADIVDVALHVICNGSSQDLETFFVTAWYIWFNRNQIVFESTSLLPSQIWDSALRLAKDFKGALSPVVQLHDCRTTHWSLPPPGFYKVQVHGASSLDCLSSSIGVIIGDSSGHVTAALSRPLPACYSPEAAEAIALEHGIILAHEMNIPHVLLESDSLSTVQSIHAKKTGGPLGHIFGGIHSSLRQFSSWSLHHLKRDRNRAAHDLAQLAKSTGTSQVWKGTTPPLPRVLFPPDPS